MNLCLGDSRIRRIFACALMLCAILICDTGFSQDRWAGIRNEIARIVQKIPIEERSGVAVLELKVEEEELQGRLGKPVTDEIVRCLCMDHNFKLLERGPLYLNAIKDEIKIGFSDLMDQNTVAQVGKWAGAKSIVAGTIILEDDLIRVHFRMIRVENAEIMGVASCELAKKDFGDFIPYKALPPPVSGCESGFPSPKRVD
ncbi:MAG: hypothetical protein KAV83_06470 [Desulfobacterales bacterium]|nr:hypothetical protein [Desulfobacterales bacterium]